MTSTGIVISLTGAVKAIATDGTERFLGIGDQVFADEQVVSGDAGTITIEFADGLMMDLGRNTQSILDEEMLNLDFDIVPNSNVAAEAEVQATQTALLQNKNFDPTVELEAPAAGGFASVEGAGEDDGYNIIQVEYTEPRMTPVSGFETNGVGVGFTELLTELILEPQQIQATGAAGVSAPLGGELTSAPTTPGDNSTLPVASIFTLDEGSDGEGGPELIDGDASKWLGFRVEPSAEDAVTSITIKGFPENDNPTISDWDIVAAAEVIDPDANYQVEFVGDGPILSENGTWEITVDITGAIPGEDVAFILTLTPFNNDPAKVPVSLEIETTVDNAGTPSTSLTLADVGILFAEILDTGNSVVLNADSSEFEVVSAIDSASFLVPVTGPSPINQYLPDADPILEIV